MASRALLSLVVIFGVWMAADAFVFDGELQRHIHHSAHLRSSACEDKLTAILALIKNNDLHVIENALAYIPKDMADCTTFISARCPDYGTLINQVCSEYFNKKN